ncbi:MAG: hypothetical protein LBQ88_03135 [Treponema sp.]|nr:hypothetical protein [Treponema sp.]
MKKILLLMFLEMAVFTLSICAQGGAGNIATGGTGNTPTGGTMKVKIMVGNTTLTATLLDNATSLAFFAKLPLTVKMDDLYNREMCYHFPDALPTDNVPTTGYEVGEIIYWPLRHSLVIMYAQNGERFSMQKIGRIDSGVEIFRSTGDANVTFEVDTTSLRFD